MSQLPRYDSYKESGIEWLGEIPSHWERIRIKFLGDIVLGLTYSPEDIVPEGNGILVLRSSNVQGGQLVFIDNVYVKKVIPEKMITTNEDILICSRNGSRNLIGKCALIKNDGIGQTFGAFMTVLRSSYRTYLYYILSSDLFKFQIGSFLTSTINQLTTYALGNFEIGFPPIFEQKIIAGFLDKRLAQIDALIAKQETLLEKLAEQRIALISHAVTKGLNHDVEMKGSGIEWLGKIPSHWVQMSLKFSLAMPITDGPHETPEILTEGIPFISAEAVKNDSLNFDKKRGYISEEDDLRFSKKYKPKFGDVYMVKSGATTGNIAKVETYERFNIWSPLAVMRPNLNKITTQFIFYILKSNYFNQSVKTKWNMGTQQNIGMGVIANIQIIMPLLDEQKIISEYLDTEIEKYQQIEKNYKKMIKKLKEYRSSLITQVVTGKIDVRDIKVS